MKNIILFGHGGSKNHGCEAIVLATCNLLRVKKNKAFLFSAHNEQDIHFKVNNICAVFHEYETYATRLSLRYLRQKLHLPNGDNENISDCKMKLLFEQKCTHGALAVSIGGDNYCYPGLPKRFAFYNNIARANGAKLILWGCSIEPVLIETDQEITTELRNYDLITARESITYQALLANGIDKNTRLYPDPAFTLETRLLDLPKGFVAGNTVGLNVSPLVQRLESNNNITYKNYAKLIEHIICNTDMQVALIPHVIWDDNNDNVPLKQLYEDYRSTGRVNLIDGDYNCMELKGYISQCRFFVGARTHATIAAYSTCVPTLALCYSVKARGIARDIFGSEKDMVMSVQSLKSDNDLTIAFEQLREREDDIRKHLVGFMPGYISKAWAAGEELRNL